MDQEKYKITLPIDGSDIEKFYKWINFNGFGSLPDSNGKEKDAPHEGFDFGMYLNTNNQCIFGLPQETPIRAIADGVVRTVNTDYVYFGTIIIEHDMPESPFSGYYHVIPRVIEGHRVKKGEVIGKLYKDQGNDKGRLVHLHFELASRIDSSGLYTLDQIDPSTILGEITDLITQPQRSLEFRIPELRRQPKVRIANFNSLQME